jgi:heat shock protein HslJ
MFFADVAAIIAVRCGGAARHQAAIHEGVRMIRVSVFAVRTAAVALGMLSIACNQLMPAKNNSPEGMLAGTAWQLQLLGTQGAIETQQPTLEFNKGNKVGGSGSCNRFTGTVTISGKAIAFSPLAATKMACADALNRQETTYFAALQQAEWFLISGTTLTIYTRSMDQPLVFFRTQPPQ